VQIALAPLRAAIAQDLRLDRRLGFHRAEPSWWVG
jgi:hypothetical protein